MRSKINKGWLLLCLLVAIEATPSCETRYDFGHSSCTFQVSYKDSSCYKFSFNQCMWTQCVDYDQDDDGDSDCARVDTFYQSSWTSCTARCCDPDVEYSKNADAIKQCQAYLDWIFRRKLIIGLTVGLGVITIFIIILCCRYRRNSSICDCIRDCCRSFCDCMGKALTCDCLRALHQEERKEERNESQLQIELRPGKVQWLNENMMKSRMDNVCSVCLEDSPSLMLECGHIFHRKCIVACMKRKRQCVLCRSTHFNKIKLYCQQCFGCYRQDTFLQNMSTIDLERQLCPDCRKINTTNQVLPP